MYQQTEMYIIKLRNDDRSVIDEIYKQYHKKIFRFSVSYLKDEDDAYDIVQDVFIKLWENRQHLKTDTNFDSYLFTVAKNTVLTLFRKRASEQKFYKQQLSENSIYEDNTEHEIDYNFLKQRYYQLVDKLPTKRKEVFLLSRENGLSNKEIALKQGISEKTVEDHLTKSLSFFRQHFGKLGIITLLYFHLFIE